MIGEPSPAEVVSFWRDAGPKRWFSKDAGFDDDIRRRFLGRHEDAAAGRLSLWETTAEGTLALLILLDQFPRNMFRGQARCYATDPLARQVANRALKCGYDQDVPEAERGFFFLPFMHSEDMADQKRSVALYREASDANLSYAERHADIIRRFGRFPHRNALLGRATTPEEQAYLDAGGFKG